MPEAEYDEWMDFHGPTTEKPGPTLGEPHACRDCGAPGTWVIDPYTEEIAGRRVATPLCDSCVRDHVMDI